ncbi:hypothetical protein CDAR_35811 [Caerostris darwini]|uniref:Uncharacterized protein n=1 Tax=Caerostris darwini TaxID=1538125 RepID=A0AAV4VCX4_9ARAC|nr:hypothetical protein CDAR_35811 [Caerostris darwini]
MQGRVELFPGSRTKKYPSVQRGAFSRNERGGRKYIGGAEKLFAIRLPSKDFLLSAFFSFVYGNREIRKTPFFNKHPSTTFFHSPYRCHQGVKKK